MMAQRWKVDGTHKRNALFEFIDAQIAQDKTIIFELIKPGRSQNQNAMIHALYGDIAAQKEDESVLDVTRRCKLLYGIGILKAGSQKFCDFYDAAIKNNLNYEEKLKAMDFLPVTRLFNTEQATQYINTIIIESAKQGVLLDNPKA